MIIVTLAIIIAILSGIAFSLFTTIQSMERTCGLIQQQQQQQTCPPCVCAPQLQQQNQMDALQVRDRAVNGDALYPPLNRGFQVPRVPTIPDANRDEGTFRLVGYLISDPQQNQSQKESWKLFGREKDRHRAEFYVTSTDKTMDLKVFITDDIATPRLRDMYSLPSSVTINHPMFTAGTYSLIENPRSDLGSSIYV
jgi:hypothetical protein